MGALRRGVSLVARALTPAGPQVRPLDDNEDETAVSIGLDAPLDPEWRPRVEAACAAVSLAAKRLACIAFVAALALSGAPAFSEEITTLAAIYKDKKSFDGRYVCILGKTETLFEKYSRLGNHYWTVWVHDGPEKVKVFGFGFPSFKEGETIEACGRYRRTKELSGRIFYDEFSAAAILKGEAMRAGRVVISADGIKPVAKAR